MLDYTSNDEYISYFGKNNIDKQLKLEYKIYYDYENVVSFDGLDEINRSGYTAGCFSYNKFSYNLVWNRYLLLTGGELGKFNPILNRTFNPQASDLMIYYDLILNKWFELNKGGTFGKEKEKLLTPLVCHCGLIINKNKNKNKNRNETWYTLLEAE